MRRLLVFALLVTAPAAAGAQFVARPDLDWRTVETEHFTVHYPAQYREWAHAVAARLESTRRAVAGIVEYAPAARVQVLVDDPTNAPNGFALPFIGQPTMVFFPVPPTPRQAIGNSRDWGELLAVHEFAHLAHLARPARARRDPWALLPLHLGPLARGAPRWAIEGFATYVEGRVTGSGRPHNAQRAALLRQWALEGRLPTYGQLSGSTAYYGNSFAYLGGSAYLEWLAAREGDSTIAHLWRRMTAPTRRSFRQAFAGVYGQSPADLYARFSAEVTRRAFTVEERIDSLGGVVAGELVQRLSWETGDPALSPDGSRIAIVLRSATKPGRVVIWNAGPDTTPARVAAARAAAQARARARDSLDVPDRQFHPPAKRVVAELEARDGRAFDTPRFLPDGRRVLVTHSEPIGSGAFRPDLHVWDSESGTTHRVTRGAGVRHADPEPAGRTAVATQCRSGWCDLVRVDLETGAVSVLRHGDPRVSYFRPRASPDGRWIAVAEQRDDRWRIVLVDAADTERTRVIASRDAASRFDVSWADSGHTLLAASEAGGITNLERIDIRTDRGEPITRVTGAAFAPDTDRATGATWFLSLHSRGLDVRRLSPGAAAVVLPSLERSLFPVVPVRPAAPPPPLAPVTTLTDRPYGTGPRATRWLPGVSRDGGAASAQLLLVNGDPVGRLELAVLGAYGSRSSWRGARAWATARRWQPALTAEGFHASQQVDRTEDAGIDDPGLEVRGGGMRTSLQLDRSAWGATVSLGVAGMQVRAPRGGGSWAARRVGWGSVGVTGRRRWLATDIAARASLHGDVGRHGDIAIAHAVTSAGVRVDLPVLPAAQVIVLHARDASGAGAGAFERIAVGGAPSVLLDPALLPQRIPMPVLPVGTRVGTRATVARAEVLYGVFSPYIWTARVHDSAHSAWHRIAGLEARFSSSAIPVVTLPRAEAIGGVGYSLDAPFLRRATVYANIAYRP